VRYWLEGEGKQSHQGLDLFFFWYFIPISLSRNGLCLVIHLLNKITGVIDFWVFFCFFVCVTFQLNWNGWNIISAARISLDPNKTIHAPSRLNFHRRWTFSSHVGEWTIMKAAIILTLFLPFFLLYHVIHYDYYWTGGAWKCRAARREANDFGRYAFWAIAHFRLLTTTTTASSL
jgi:hypothetical protein